MRYLSGFHPLCVGVCSNWNTEQITEALHQQRDHYAVIRERISSIRLKLMTPETMRAEIEDLARRISAARASMKHPEVLR